MTQWASATPFPVNEWTGRAVVFTLPPTSMNTGSPVGAEYPEHAWRGSGNSPPLYAVRGSLAPLPGKYTGYAPPLKELPRRVSSVAPSCQGLVVVSLYEPNPVIDSRGSIIAIAWNGAAIHQSMTCGSVVLVLELTWMLPLRAAVSPAV